MIHDLDVSLRAFLQGEAPAGSELASAEITFAVPDKAWRGSGAGLDLDVYLFRVTENRELRSNERRLRYGPGGSVATEPAPARVECSYLITAWNKAADTSVERELQEHRLLGQVMYVLLRNPTIPDAYRQGLIAGQEIPPPMVSAQPGDEAAGAPEFWSALETHVRPSILCRVTLAMDLARSFEGAFARTIQVGVGADELFTIGGIVFTGTPLEPVAGAWIRVDETGRVYASDRAGKFRIERLARGSYTLTVRAVGFQEAVGTIDVPQLDGGYDVTLVPL